MTNHIEETKAKIAVMQAYVDGKAIEYRLKGLASNGWDIAPVPSFHWDVADYRIATTPDTIDWSHVAPEYKWMARDENGVTFIHSSMPTLTHREWAATGFSTVGVSAFSSYRLGTCDWRDSLVERPS